MIEIPHAGSGPYLPGVGEVYRVDPSVVHPVRHGRARTRRPAVLVVAVPATVDGRITVVIRTVPPSGHRRPATGIPSPADQRLGFDEPGAWEHLRSAEANLWTSSMVQYRGTVELAVLTAVRAELGL